MLAISCHFNHAWPERINIRCPAVKRSIPTLPFLHLFDGCGYSLHLFTMPVQSSRAHSLQFLDPLLLALLRHRS